VVVVLWFQAEYREKRRRYLTQFDGVLPDLCSADLDVIAAPPVSSSSSGDHEGAPLSPSVVVAAVSRQDSVSSGDASSVDARRGARLAAGDAEYPDRDSGRGAADADALSMRSLPEDRLADAGADDDGRLSVDRRSVSASVPNFQAHRAWLDDPPVSTESFELVDVQPSTAEPDLDVAETDTINHHYSSVTQADDAGSARAPAAGTPTDDVEHDLRRSAFSSSWSAQHQGLFAAQRCLVTEQLLLDNTAFAAS